jgi:xylulokinase
VVGRSQGTSVDARLRSRQQGGRAVDTYLVIDVGLTHCKAVLFDIDGKIVGAASVSYPTHRPRSGWVEQAPQDWWAAAVAATREMAATRPELAAHVEGIAVTGHMHALVALDSSGRPIRRALVLGDRRSRIEAAEIESELGRDQLYAVTGALMDPSMPAAELRYLAAHEPETIGRASFFLGCKDYLRHRLTGDIGTDPTDACATSIYDIRSAKWSAELAALAGVKPSQLPPVHDPARIAGYLASGAATDLGLPSGIPVVVGAGDDVEILGYGWLESGATVEHVGTTGMLMTATAAYSPDPGKALEIYPHAVAGRWVLGGSMTSAGSAIDWATRLLGYRDLSAAASTLVEARRNSSPVFVPHLDGQRFPVHDAHVKGSWLELDLATTRTDLMASVFSGVAYSLKQLLEGLDCVAGRQAVIHAAQTAGSVEPWLQYRANVYGRPVVVHECPEPTALGSLALLMVALGIHAEVATAAGSLADEGRYVVPDPQSAEAESARYAAYVALVPSPKPLQGVRIPHPVVAGEPRPRESGSGTGP